MGIINYSMSVLNSAFIDIPICEYNWQLETFLWKNH